jgi:phage tail sheath protein FI
LDGTSALAPPCGFVAGVFASTDARVGVHKAPANVALAGVADVADAISAADQAQLNAPDPRTGARPINCIRAFPGRGIRIWGARTLADDPAWRYISVRRIFLTAARWIERNLDGLSFEGNDARLWATIRLQLNVYLNGLYRAGALRGATPAEAFYVRCDASTNPPEVRAAGQVVTEIGLAAAVPNEFVVVQIVHDAGGVAVTAAG